MMAGAGFALGIMAAAAWLGRYNTHPVGPQGMVAWVHDRWAGTIQLCRPNAPKCIPLFPSERPPPSPLPEDWMIPLEPPSTRVPAR